MAAMVDSVEPSSQHPWVKWGNLGGSGAMEIVKP